MHNKTNVGDESMSVSKMYEISKKKCNLHPEENNQKPMRPKQKKTRLLWTNEKQSSTVDDWINLSIKGDDA